MNVDILFLCPLPGICSREVSLFALLNAKILAGLKKNWSCGFIVRYAVMYSIKTGASWIRYLTFFATPHALFSILFFSYSWKSFTVFHWHWFHFILSHFLKALGFLPLKGFSIDNRPRASQTAYKERIYQWLCYNWDKTSHRKVRGRQDRFKEERR